eukprot:Lankesteria_metandrocarpae@DN2718_c0_g1_i10.p1
MLHIPFRCAVSINAIKIICVPSAGDGTVPPADAPKNVRLFLNKPSLTFNDTDTEAAADDIELTKENVCGGEPYKLRYVKYRFVHHLALFIHDTFGDSDVMRIKNIEILGTSGESLKMNDWKPVKNTTGEE